MDIHPIFVHFPIALMTIYAIAEIVSFTKLKETAYWFYVKAVLVISGTLFAFLSLNTGETAEHLANKTLRPLIETHSKYANASTWIFGFLALVYVISWIGKTSMSQKLYNSGYAKIWNIKLKGAEWVLGSPIMLILSIVGLATITITGALGGAIVYGPEIDPIVSFIYHLFF